VGSCVWANDPIYRVGVNSVIVHILSGGIFLLKSGRTNVYKNIIKTPYIMDHYYSDLSEAETVAHAYDLYDSDDDDDWQPITQLEQQRKMMAAVLASEDYKIETFNYGTLPPEDRHIDVELFEDNMRLCGFECVKNWVRVPLRPNFCISNWIDTKEAHGLAEHGEGNACIWREIDGNRKVYCLWFKTITTLPNTTLMASSIEIDGIFTSMALQQSYPEPVSTGLCNKCGLLRLG
jgi:hypothetical protein